LKGDLEEEVEEVANLALATIVQTEIILTKFSIYNDVWLKHYPVLRVWKEHVKKARLRSRKRY